ncbi:hypothetical protein PIB30_089803 [Stylosanthes scabra]|uniref:Transposase n=1 Tax=Stylosanthes scabra TaxID=79078 RepID=A0ABU6SV17_9FABA|nr:hypothetical protein [Stylosanthes scabra]
MHDAWLARAAKRLRELFHGIHEKGYPSNWIPDDIFKQLKKYWASDEYMALKRTNKANRASSAGGSLHTGGSITYPATAKKILEELGHTPTQSEVFTQTHTKKKDRGQWVDRRAEDTNIMMRFGLGLPVAAREVGSTDVARSCHSAQQGAHTVGKGAQTEGQALSDRHAAQIRHLQSSFDTQMTEFNRWKSTVSQMYSFMQNMQAGSASSSTGIPPPMPPPPPPPPPLQHEPSGATDQPPSDADRSPDDDPDYI